MRSTVFLFIAKISFVLEQNKRDVMTDDEQKLNNFFKGRCNHFDYTEFTVKLKIIYTIYLIFNCFLGWRQQIIVLFSNWLSTITHRYRCQTILPTRGETIERMFLQFRGSNFFLF